MLRSHHVGPSVKWLVRRVVPFGTLAGAALLAGCSADISRLEKPTYALGERGPIPSEPIGRRNAGAPPAYENAGWGDSGPRGGTQLPPPRNDRVTALPEVSPPVNPSHPFDAPRKTKTVVAPPPGKSIGAPIAPGATVEVQQGDSLYALSKRHRVSIAALMELNGLKNASIKPGQKIVLPANAQRPLAKAPVVPGAAVGQAPLATPPITSVPPMAALPPPARAAAAAPAAPAAPTGDWNGSYVVKSGDSLYGIARAHKVQVAELQRQNAITDALKMKPGMALKVPAGSAGVAAGAPQSNDALPAPAAAPAPLAAAPAPAAVSGGVRLLNPPADALPPKDVAALPSVKVAGPATATAASVGGTKFRWPARGTTLAGFGKRPDGAHNDGINIAVPAGADIAAAEAGTVAYAGGEIKAYGNLVLVRHEGGWVTAYAHADKILVKRGDSVTRGQIIAKAGTTGSVDQPQIHFELRQGSKPVDPAPHMEK